MKKFTKLLAVLLAIAVIVCPMVSALSVSADAAPSGTYKLEQVNGNTVRLTISSTDGFLVYKAVINCTKDKETPTVTVPTTTDNYTVKSPATKDQYNKPAISANTVGDDTTILVSATDAGTLDLYTEVVIDIGVTTGSKVAITNIQAADDGEIQDDPTLLAFPAVADAADGDINTEDPDYPAADAEIENVHTHSFTTTPSTSQASAATCTANQFMWAKCDNCDAISDSVRVEIAGTKLAHSFTTTPSTSQASAATCTANQFMWAKCDNCDAISDSVKVETAGTKLGHDFTDATDTTDIKEAANCLHGTIYYMGCTRCDATAKGNDDTATWTASDVTAHTWGEWGATTGATCTKDGTHTRSCTVVGCTATDTETVAGSKLGHDFTDATDKTDVKEAANCIHGTIYYKGCSRCDATAKGYNESAVWTDTDVAPHTWSYTPNGNGTHNAVCTNACSCGQTITNEACDGSPDGTCSKCGYKWHVHSYTDHFEVITQPTKDAKGSKKSFCSCGEFITEEIAKTTAAPDGLYVTDTNLVVTELVAVSYGVSKKNILATGADSYKLVFDYEGYDNYNTVPKQTVIDWNAHDSANGTDNKRFYTFKDIPLYFLGANYTITVYFYKDGVAVNHYIVPETNIIAITNADCAANISNTRVVKAYADMIQYASEAQAYFANQYKDKDIATAALPTESFNYTSYATAPGDASIPYRAVNSGAVVATGSPFAAFEPSVMLDTSNQFSYIIKFPSPTTNDASKLVVRVHYTNGYGTVVSRDYTVANGGLSQIDTTAARTRYSVTFDNLALYDLEKSVYCDVIYDGVKQYTYTYTLGNYVNTQAGATSGMQYVVKAMGVFYESAKDCLFPTGNYIAD
ncbi:MAG: hypothetical protein MJ080_04595 [Clostridia bacterium]|nr:hypothetical protein [Clostridia bacterium]